MLRKKNDKSAPVKQAKPAEADSQPVVSDSDIETMPSAKSLAEMKASAKTARTRSGFFSKKKDRSDELRKNLESVYDEGSKASDMNRLEIANRPPWKTTLYSLIVILIFLLAVAAAGFWFFANYASDGNFTNKKVSIKIESPISVASGKSQAYAIVVSNQEKTDLYDISVKLDYPANFTMGSSTPQGMGERRNLWKISALKSGEQQRIEFSGTMRAPINSTQTFKAEMDYKPANVNADYRQEAYLDALVSSSDIDMTVNGPEQAMANQPVEYVINLSNNSEAELRDVQVVAQYPDGFSFTSADVAPDGGGNNVWSFSVLPVKSTSTDATATSTYEKVIRIQGTYAQVDGTGNRQFKVKADLRVNGDYMTQSEQYAVTSVVRDQLELQMVINGSATDQSVNFSDNLAYTISFRNVGQEDLKNISIKAYLNSKVLDFGTLVDENGGIRNGNYITWNGDRIPKLLKLSAGDEGMINFQIKVKNDSVADDPNVAKFAIESSVEATGRRGDSTQSETLAKSRTIVNSINADISVETRARYYNEDNMALGAGPVVPKSGERSTYNIVWKLANKLHDSKDLEMSAILPQNVIWEDAEDHDKGDVIYNAQTKKLVWKIANLPKSANGAQLDFNVSVVPNSSDVGKILVLVPPATITGHDSTANASISKTANAATTDFNDPILGQTGGIVE